ncbi:glycosyltransferase family 2 protein (plasmid) [Azospirillum argentinense]|uniref:Glycosyltransferase family 2 protein n=1 Tax=Azospirillum argentinense TaxID=2970906 RepID=A0A4D8PJA6_9PROT|nr:glycosyltransferase family A protein [Azospirillum argentinense]QCN97414.1 glycosyltransferase family 2 protein [Azospirillum argentinense]
MYGAPKISVVIPCYNAERTIGETLASAAMQTLRAIEIIVVDDGSSDRTAEIVTEFAMTDRRVILHRQVNRGVSAARNRGVALSRAPIVAFLDADDLWLPDALAAHHDHLGAHPDMGVSFARVRFMNYDGTDSSASSTGRVHDLAPQHLLCENPTSTTSTWVVRRAVFNAVGGFDETLSHAEDQEFLFRMMALSPWKLAGLDRILVRYRASANGLSSDFSHMEGGWHRLMDCARCHAPDLVATHEARATAVMMRYLARRAVRLQAGFGHAVNYMARCLRADWRLALAEPRRTILTFLGVCTYPIMRMLARKVDEGRSVSPVGMKPYSPDTANEKANPTI